MTLFFWYRSFYDKSMKNSNKLLKQAIACFLSVALTTGSAFAGEGYSRQDLEEVRSQQQTDISLMRHKLGNNYSLEDVLWFVGAGLMGVGVGAGVSAAIFSHKSAPKQFPANVAVSDTPAAAEFFERGAALEGISAKEVASAPAVHTNVQEILEEGAAAVKTATAEAPVAFDPTVYVKQPAKPIDYQKMSPSQWEKISGNRIDEIFDLDVQFAEAAKSQKRTWYPASWLGEDNIRFLQNVLDRSLSNVEIPAVFPVQQKRSVSDAVYGYLRNPHKYPMAANQTVFVVREGQEQAFAKEVRALMQKYRFNANTRIGVNLYKLDLHGVLSLVDLLVISDDLTNTIQKQLLKGNEALLKCVETVPLSSVAKGGQFSFKMAGKTLVKKMGLPAFMLGLIGGSVSLWNRSADEKEVLARVEQNPTLLLGLSDEDFERVTSSEELSRKYVQVSQALHELAVLPSQELQEHADYAADLVKAQRMQMKQHLVMDLQKNMAR